MNIIDNSCITHILKNNLEIQDEYYMAPGVVEEVDFFQTQINQPLPKLIYEISRVDIFNEIIYIDFYKQMLNKYRGTSFFSMTGFGDVSILAAVHTILHAFENKMQKEIFMSSDIVVFTDDTGLSKRLKKEFANKNVELKSFTEIRVAAFK